MKKIIVASSILILSLASVSHAENVIVLGGGSDNVKVLITTDDNGVTRSSTAQRIGDNSWLITGEGANSTIVNDFSGGDGMGKDSD